MSGSTVVPDPLVRLELEASAANAWLRPVPKSANDIRQPPWVGPPEKRVSWADRAQGAAFAGP
jgi:hypothetical protein